MRRYPASTITALCGAHRENPDDQFEETVFLPCALCVD
ncbi:hypothetical protein SAMN05446935_8857 [Burkholderia sp. YR290]|jgi:hypothetical protein|nr:hypothetical protein SAMN05446934_7654 [Paraburkholderia hospita]SOE89590.1 hypothetical protein SAMN05446935_8857 [Burkholderia sp. YR290]